MRRIAVLFAVSQEAAPFESRLTGLRPLVRGPSPLASFLGLRSRTARLPAAAHVGMLGRCEVLSAVGGMGAARATAATRYVLDVWEPELLVVAGVAGALQPHLRCGDLVAATRVASESDSLTPNLVPQALPEHPDFHQGCLLSLDRVLITAEEKRGMAAAWEGALAVEMETAAAAGVVAERGRRWAAIRAVSDGSQESLPLDFNSLRDKDGDMPMAAVASAALSQPASIPGLLRLGRNTSLAAGRLAAYLETWLTRWE